MAKANMKNMSLTRRRRAIYSGLFPYMQGDQLFSALCLWQQQYSNLPSFAIGSFISEIVDKTPLGPKRAAIHLSVTSHLMVEEENLAPEPLEEMYEYLVRVEGKSKADAILSNVKKEAVNIKIFDSRSDVCKVYEMVMNLFLKSVAEKNVQAALEIEKTVFQKLKNLNVGEKNMEAIKTWLKDKTVLQINVEIDKLQESLNAAYVTSCNWLGPMSTDKIMNAVIELVDKDEVSKSFSPRELL